MKKPYYLRRIGQRGRIKIWLVSGAEIRKELDEEFTNFGQHFRFPYIPKYEFWLDREMAPNERRFYIDHLLVEWNLMNQGIDYDSAIERAGQKEKAERIKAGDLEKAGGKDLKPDIGKIHLEMISKTKKDLEVWLVYGRLVRSSFNIDFTQGGHDLVFGFVPKEEIWLDNDLLESERPYVLLHELYERRLMKKGMNYNPAHRRASRLEWRARQDKELLNKWLVKLGVSNYRIL